MIIIFLNIVSHMYHNLQIFESIELIIKFSLIYNIYNKNIFSLCKKLIIIIIWNIYYFIIIWIIIKI